MFLSWGFPELKHLMPPQDELDEITQKVVGFDTTLNYWERNRLVWKLRKRKLTQKDFEAFFAFLKMPFVEGNLNYPYVFA